MVDQDAETIFALASAQGVAGVAIVRVSGPGAIDVLRRLTRQALPEARRAVVRQIFDSAGDMIDQGLVLRFDRGSSYTGEEVVELHCHGGLAIVRALLTELARHPGCRMAEPGEFTRRALLAGRMDLAEVETLGDLLSAETELQRRLAMGRMNGAVHARVDEWRALLVRAAALIEVTIDWADEEVPEDVSGEVSDLLETLLKGINDELERSRSAERIRTGFEVALIGAPNAGKSSLFNALAGREAALTSPHAGTTRDVLELRYDLEGIPVTFLDMAGLRESEDPVEAMGIMRARQRAAAADLRILLDAPTENAGPDAEALMLSGDLRVLAKSDLGRTGHGLPVSVKSGEGLTELLEEIRLRLSREVAQAGVIAHERQRLSLTAARDRLAAARRESSTEPVELLAAELRMAMKDLEVVLGRVGVEDVLDDVFASFCLGK